MGSSHAAEKTLMKSMRRNGFITKKSFIPIIKQVRRSMAAFKSGDADIALGIILTTDGLLLTKASEVVGADELTVIIDGKVLQPKLLARDDKRDLALYKVQAMGLAPVSWVDQQDVNIGQWCVAPVSSDFEGKIGIISAPTRPLSKQPVLGGKNLKLSGTISKHPDDFPVVYQQDIPLWAHEIGGPLANSSGKVFAINVSRSNRSEFFSLPASEVKKSLAAMDLAPLVVEQLASIEFPQQKLFSVQTKPMLDKERIDLQRSIIALHKNLRPASVCIKFGADFGSGVLATADGYVLTAAHVSGDPGTVVEIILNDGRKFKAKSLGFYKKTDMSLLKITDDVKNLPFVKMGQCEKVRNTDWCFVIAHPNGYRQARGSVIRIGRILKSGVNSFIRTDCNLIGGDSGGPLFNMNGEVIGINSQVQDHYERNYHGPVACYQANWKAFLKEREIAGEEIGPLLTQSKVILGFRGRTLEQGALVSRVEKGTPAARAGLKSGDFIMKVNGEPIGKSLSLRQALRSFDVGSVVLLSCKRSGSETIIKLKRVKYGSAN